MIEGRGRGLGRVPLWVGLLFAVLYAATAAESVQAHNDSGELVAVAHSFGVAHPPGFPTFTIIAGLWVRLLPWSSAVDLAFLSALGGAFACGCLAWIAIRLGAAPWAAATAAAIWGLMPQTWALHTVQEVVGLAHPAVAAILVAAVLTWEGRRRWAPLALGVACGAGVGVHPIVVFAAPMVIVALTKLRGRGWALAAGGLVAGLGTHAYFLYATGAPHWGELDSVGAIVAHALRVDYGTLDLALGQQGSRVGALARYGVHLVRDGAVVWAAAALAGLVIACRRGAWRGPRLGIAASFLVAAVLFRLGARPPDTAWWREIAARFFPIADLFAACLVAWSLTDAVARWPMVARLRYVWAAAWIVVVAMHAAPTGPMRGRALVQQFGDDLLASLPPRAILVGQSDLHGNAVWEAQIARGVRRDVDLVMADLLPAPWYAHQIAARIGYRHPPKMAGLRLLFEHAARTGRPVYLAGGLPPGLRGQFSVMPEGIAWLVLPPGAPPPGPADVEPRLQAFFDACAPDLRLAWWQEYRAVELQIIQSYIASWQGLRAIHERLGDHAGVARAQERIDALLAGRLREDEL